MKFYKQFCFPPDFHYQLQRVNIIARATKLTTMKTPFSYKLSLQMHAWYEVSALTDFDEI